MGTGLTGVSGRDCYANLYLTQLEAEAEWLRRGALDKADSVEQLLARNGIVPRTLTELGAGTGAVISECRRRGLGQTFTAVDDAASVRKLQFKAAIIEVWPLKFTISDENREELQLTNCG